MTCNDEITEEIGRQIDAFVAAAAPEILKAADPLATYEAVLTEVERRLEASEMLTDVLAKAKKKVMKVTFFKVEDGSYVMKDNSKPKDDGGTDEGETQAQPPNPLDEDGNLLPGFAVVQISEVSGSLLPPGTLAIQTGQTQYCYYVGGRRRCFRR